MTRYITKWYCTTQVEQVERLCGIDHTQRENVLTTENVELWHVSSTWAYWSDGRITAAVIGKTEKDLSKQVLSDSAAGLISTVRGADCGEVEGGWPVLTRIAKELSRTRVQVSPPRGLYQGGTIEKIGVENNDGTRATLYEWSIGYIEGYSYVLCESLDSLKKRLEKLQLRTWSDDE